jgi:voltage-gated potassium channel
VPRVRLVKPIPYRLLIAMALPFVLVLVGTLGYWLIERWDPFDALYMAVITLTTVGYREVHPLSRMGEWFTIALLLGGVFTLFYAATTAISGIVRGDLADFLGSRRMERILSEMQDHTIICGLGRMGRLVCQHFAAERLPFVVIDRDAESCERFSLPPGVAIHGDAASDEVLLRAGIERAKNLVSVVASDADNLYITMSARLLNERLFIAARAEDERSEQKLLRAGASRVISPYLIGGARIAQAVLRPNVVDFLDLATKTEHLELNIEEAQVSSQSPLANRSLAESELPREHRVIIVAIKHEGKMLFYPPEETLIRPRDVLIMLGRRQDLDAAAARLS